jgi:glycosyltransferase involved in cell wall biosynthesis
MKIAVLAPVAWRTPPRHYGPWEQIASNITEGLVTKGLDVTLFATGDSITGGKLAAVIGRGYEEDRSQDAKVVECLHISHLMENAGEFDLIHNHFDFLPLTYSKLIKTPIVTTIHGFSSQKIIPVFKKYNSSSYYVSISDADRNPQLTYSATIYNGINTSEFKFNDIPGDYLLYFGRIHPHKGTSEAIDIALKSKRQLLIAGIVQDRSYFENQVKPRLNDQIVYVGEAGPEKRNELMRNAFVLLHPISFEEPFGLSVAEAMLCGTPVIAFNRGSMPELIKDSKTGYLVKNINESVEALKNIPKLKRRDCYEWSSSQFSQERMVNDYANLYHQVLAKH